MVGIWTAKGYPKGYRHTKEARPVARKSLVHAQVYGWRGSVGVHDIGDT
jgi:hypothetical protein